MTWYWSFRTGQQRAANASPSLEDIRQPRPQSDAKMALQSILASANASSPSSTTTARPDASSRSWSLSSDSPTIPPKEVYQLKRQTATLRGQVDEAQGLILSTTDALKEFGDLQTWAEVVWRDIYVLEEVFALVDSGINLEEATMGMRDEA